MNILKQTTTIMVTNRCSCNKSTYSANSSPVFGKTLDQRKQSVKEVLTRIRSGYSVTAFRK